MRAIGNFLVALAETVVGLVVFAYVTWGEWRDGVKVRARRRDRDPEPRRGSGPDRHCYLRNLTVPSHLAVPPHAEGHPVYHKRGGAGRPTRTDFGSASGCALLAPARQGERTEKCLRY